MVSAQDAKSGIIRLSFSYVGLLIGFLFFGFSLTPSLLPREAFFQGFISGIAFMTGYAIGLIGQNTWLYLQLPIPHSKYRTPIDVTATVLTALATFVMLWQYVGWQNEVRQIFGVDMIAIIQIIPVLVFTVLVAAVILIIARAIRQLYRFLTRHIERVIPQRLANVVGTVLAFLVVIFVLNGVIVRGFFAAANSIFSLRDSTIDTALIAPSSPLKSGSIESEASWGTLGRQGRLFVSTGPTASDIDAVNGGGALEPIRVYAGLKSAAGRQAQADLALAELKRTGAFDRSVLLIATTTGTGWLDANALEPFEYVQNGDSAVVGVQYSYLPSWISLLADQQVARQTSRTVFDTIHTYWLSLPVDERPELYLYGLSLGSFGVESILSSINIINEPIDGALLAGPPFVNRMWSDITTHRDPGTPAWQPVYEQGRTVRFTGREDALEKLTGTWGDTKVIYMQHASDPVVFFSPGLAIHEPDWLQEGQRGPDVSPSMRWIPFVTMWQVAADLPSAATVPDGYGHNYDATANVDAWVALTSPDNWSPQKTAILKAYFASLKD